MVDGTLVRVVDLTPGGAGIIAPGAIEVGSEVRLHLDLTDVRRRRPRGASSRFTVRSCRPAPDLGWRMGGTLTPVREIDGELLIEHCHVVTTRARLLESGRLSPEVAGRPILAPVPTAGSEPRSAHG